MKKLVSVIVILLTLLGISTETAQACFYGNYYRPVCRPVKQTGKLELKKYDGRTGKALGGATFTIYNSSGKAVQTIKSNSRGIASSSDLDLGTYTIKETQAPSGYSLDPTLFTFTIRCRGQIVNLCFGNRKQEEKGMLRITKVDTNSGQTLSGAEFEVTDSAGKKQTATTGSDGTAFLYDLSVGQAKIIETKAPEGYTAEKTQSSININANKIAEITLKNKKNQEYGSLRILKVDSESGKTLSGAEFEVVDSLGRTQNKTTTSNGTVLFTDLAVGAVTINETKAPNGYTAENLSSTATIVANKEIISVIKNKKNQQYGSLIIKKVDSETGALLSGAEFKVTDSLGNSQTQTTGSDGTITLTGLAVGQATINETKAPEGYSVNNAQTEVTILANATETISITNKKQVGSLEITKVDSSDHSTLLSGAKFTITDSKGNSYSGTTNSNGTLTFQNLPLGEVTITETQAPDGYIIIGDGKTRATIVENQVTKTIIENDANDNSRKNKRPNYYR